MTTYQIDHDLHLHSRISACSNDPEQTEQQCRDLAQLAARHGLLATGGSDFHGMYSHILRPIGYADLPENTPQLMRNFRARRQTRTG